MRLILGYLNESGTLNLARFEAYMRKLGSFDIKQFREKYDDLRYLEKKTGKSATKVNNTIAIVIEMHYLVLYLFLIFRRSYPIII